MVQDNAIYIVPASLQEANDYLAEHIRRCQPMRGCKFSVGCALDGELVGAAIVGRMEKLALCSTLETKLSLII